MSAELEVLDQLVGGDMPLAVIRTLFASDEHFMKSIHAMLVDGEIRLMAPDAVEVPRWRWRELLVEGRAMREMGDLRLGITDRGARRIV